MHAYIPVCHYAGVGFNQSEYILREELTNHSVPVGITGGKIPVDTIVQVETTGKYNL